MDDLQIKRVETESELEQAIALRFRVFVDEQSISPEEELDAADATAIHAIALCQEKVVGTGRLLMMNNADAQIGRMAVDQAWRRRGVGSQILEFLEQSARTLGLKQSVLHAQDYVKNFYATHGYREQGDPFLEVNILHVEMRKRL